MLSDKKMMIKNRFHLTLCMAVLMALMAMKPATASIHTSTATAVSASAGPPAWAPAHGYKAQTRYVYFPAASVYFDLHLGMYAYMDNGSWVTVRTLPSRYSRYDFKKLKQEELPSGMDPKSHQRKQGKGQGKSKGKSQGRGR
jgi:hypothetical protein